MGATFACGRGHSWGQMRRALPILMTVTLLALAVASMAVASQAVPRGFIGISPQGVTRESDYELMQLAGIESMRLPMSWASIEPDVANLEEPEWESFDARVRQAAEHGMRVFPFFWGTPEWVSPYPSAEPVESAWQRYAWTSFLRESAGRYGPGGEFWEENPDLPHLPIRRWEIWNEENIVTFSHQPNPVRFTQLIRISGRVLHRADPGSKV